MNVLFNGPISSLRRKGNLAKIEQNSRNTKKKLEPILGIALLADDVITNHTITKDIMF